MSDIVISQEDFLRIEQVIIQARAQRSGRDRENLDRLEQELRRARLVPAAELPADVVALNSDFTVRDLVHDTSESYRLVLPELADLEHNRISVLAPVGAALLGYRQGDQVDWPVPGGVRSLRLELVEQSGRRSRIEGA
jgi:regulator of nucleoside diphosphate kinase